MMHEEPESVILTPTNMSPDCSPPAVYFVDSPSTDNLHDTSRDSHDDEADKSSSDYSFSRHAPSPCSSTDSDSSGSSPGSRYPGRRKFNRFRRHYCHVVDEEKSYFNVYEVEQDEKRKEAHCKCLSAIFTISILFFIFCCIYWSASKPYKVRVLIQSLEVEHLYYGEGTDLTGVPTKLLTVKCSASMLITNPATFFGIHITSSSISLFYTGLAIATGRIDKYYQPRKSNRLMKVDLVGHNVPLYGSGMELEASDEHGGIPVKLEFDVYSIAYLIGKLVKRRHTRRISCSLVISSKDTKEFIFYYNSCEYS